MNLNGVMLGSEKPDELGKFYTKIFGNPGWQENDWYGFQIGSSSLMIGPHSEVKGTNPSPARIMLSIETEDLLTRFAKIKKLGATVIAEPYQPSKDDNPEVWLATFADPDGNYFQLTTPWEE